MTSGNVKTSGDWMSLFLGHSNSSPSIYSKFSSYDRPRTYVTPRYDDTLSHISRVSSYDPSYRPSRPFKSRFLKNSYFTEDEKRDQTLEISAAASDSSSKCIENVGFQAGVLNPGSTKLRKSDGESTDEEAVEEEEEEDDEEEEEEEEEEDPLDAEEREIMEKLNNNKETLSFSEEDDLRKRLFRVKQGKFKRNQLESGEDNCLRKFLKVTEEIVENTSRDEEEKTLIKKLSSRNLTEVDQKDIQVRLQEIFRDRKSELEASIQAIESQYNHIIEETSTELTELETSIRGKNQLLAKLQDEILSMNVRKEILHEDMESLNSSHHESVMKLEEGIQKVNSAISKYSVLIPASTTTTIPSRGNFDADELKELEAELECPICMDISRPPIYQCEEGHIVCSSCKPLLNTCPHCDKKYSEPAIRCRFAEKLSIKYFALADDPQVAEN